MKKINYSLAIILIAVLSISCSEIRSVTDIVTQPTARELYKREFKDSLWKFDEWQSNANRALKDSLFIDLPYNEIGKFSTYNNARSYTVELEEGETLYVSTTTDSLNYRIFTEVLEITGDTLTPFKSLSKNTPGEKVLAHPVDRSKIYKILIQPEIGSPQNFSINIYTQPQYEIFPVAGKDNKAIQSFWGDIRSGGRRTHQGIDIFAPKGTPVIATVNGSVRYTGERGLGGKQVWLNDNSSGNSLYYAHLDSIVVNGWQKVNIGDTLGFVGNTGNAKFTPPHLHFGIYKRFRGAVNPLPFVKKYDIPAVSLHSETFPEKIIVKNSITNLRNTPGTRNSKILGVAQKNDTLTFMGKTDKWIYAQTPDKKAVYIYENLTTPLLNEGS